MNVHDQAKENMQVVQKMMDEQNAKKGQAIQAGNSALITVEIIYTADSGTNYEGVLQFRRPSPMDYIKMGAIKSNMYRAFGIQPIVTIVNGQLIESMAHLDNSVKYLANAIATFDVLLVNGPAWTKAYKSEDFIDTDLLTYAYNRFDNELVSFRSGTQGVPSGDSEATSGTENVPSEEALRERES